MLRFRRGRPGCGSYPKARSGHEWRCGWCWFPWDSLRVRAFAESAVGDALQEAGVVFKGADHRPARLVGVAVEMVVAERLQASEQLVDFGLLADEGVERCFLVPRSLLGAQLVAGCGDRVQA